MGSKSKLKIKCPNGCGKMVHPDFIKQHERFCKAKEGNAPVNAEPEKEVVIVEDDPTTTTDPAETVVMDAPQRATIPYSDCPREIRHLPEGKLIFLDVTGRKKDGVFVIETTRLRR